MTDEHDYDDPLWEAGRTLAEGVTDQALITYDDALSVVRSMPRGVLVTYAAHTVQMWARNYVRQRVRLIEQAAVAATPVDNGLYLGKYKHGSVDKQRGAIPRGCGCDYCTEVREIERRSAERMATDIRRVIDGYRANLVLDWYEELLEASFAVNTRGDTVTWGAATVADHQACVAMLEGNMLALGTNSARHLEAVAAIEAAGVTNLDELVAEAVNDASTTG